MNQNLCKTDGCDEPARSAGHCKRHYEQLRRKGAIGAPTRCSAEGCDRSALSKGLCDTHYRRLKNHGDLRGRTLETRLLKKINKNGPNDCWLWTGGTWGTGYGVIRVRNVKTATHRAAYETWVGPIPEGLTLDHLCRNKLCVNPEHLEPVTLRENILRSNNPPARWARRTVCDEGHEFDAFTKDGYRYCLTCRRAQRAAYHRRKRAEKRAAG